MVTGTECGWLLGRLGELLGRKSEQVQVSSLQTQHCLAADTSNQGGVNVLMIQVGVLRSVYLDHAEAQHPISG
jgi:hypothetical protein